MSLDEKTKMRMYQAIFEKSPMALLIADDQGRLVDLNPAGEKLFGAKKSALIDKPIADYVAPMKVKETKELWSDFAKSGFQAGTFTVSRENGTDRLIQYVAVSQILPGLHLSIAQDITDHK